MGRRTEPSDRMARCQMLWQLGQGDREATDRKDEASIIRATRKEEIEGDSDPGRDVKGMVGLTRGNEGKEDWVSTSTG